MSLDGVVLKLSGRYLAAGKAMYDQQHLAVTAALVQAVAQRSGVGVVIGGGNLAVANQEVVGSVGRSRREDLGRRACALNMLFVAEALEHLGVAFEDISLESADVQELRSIGAAVGARLEAGAVVLIAGTLGLVGVNADFVAVELAALMGVSRVVFAKNGVRGFVDPKRAAGLDSQKLGREGVMSTVAVSEALSFPNGPVDKAALSVAAACGISLFVISADDPDMAGRLMDGGQVGTQIVPSMPGTGRDSQI